MKKPVIVFTTADKNNFKYALMLLNSLRKFHDWPVILVTDEDSPDQLSKLPKNVEVKPLSDYLSVDPNFFYRQKPIIAEPLMDDYELVLGLDSDQIITGDLSYILDTKDYDIAGVLNFNQVDAQMFGIVQGWGILPVEYMNCGLVAMRSKKFVHDWKVWCYSQQFDRCQYREQDGLNVMVYHGNWNVRILDHGDGPAKMTAYWGLFAKTFWPMVVLKEGKMVVPAIEGGIPPVETELKIIHFATGNTPNKANYRLYFQPDVAKHLDYLTSK